MSSPKLMSDPLDPTPDDLRRWAYTPDAEYPDEMPQDWDLCVATIDRAQLLLEFASDAACPTRGFFLGCLYILAGDCVRLEHHQRDLTKLRDILRAVPPTAPKEVLLWAERTNYLIAHPESFEYGKWGWGDLARSDGGE